jgi:hypothetical protein
MVYEELKSPEINMKSCVYCIHHKVCAVYDAFMDADIVANDYAVLAIGYDDRVYEVLADSCSQFAW